MQLLQAECFSCHNPEKKKGGLVLTTREKLLQGGEDGPVVVPGQPDSSRIVQVILRDADPHMPPKKQLADTQVKLLREWIKAGLTWDAVALAESESLPPIPLAELPQSYHPVTALSLSPDGKRLAAGRGGSLVLYDTTTRTNFPVLREWQAHRDAVQALAWSGDGRWVISGAFRQLTVWNAETSQAERTWTNGLLGRVTAIRLSPDGRTLALADGVAAQSGFVRSFSFPELKPLGAWRAHDDTVFDLAFSHDGKSLVTAGGDKLIKVWDVATKKEQARLEGHTAQVLAVAFNTNATQVVSAGADKQLKVWDIKTREKILDLGKHTGGVTALAWPGDGKVIAAVTEAGGVFTYKNLKAHSGEQSSGAGDEQNLGETGEALLSLAVASDANTLFTGSQDGSVQVWNSAGKRLASLAPSRPPNARPLPVAPEAPSSPPSATLPFRRPQLSPALARLKSVLSITVEPRELLLSADAPLHGLLVSGRTADGFEVDATEEARFSLSPNAPFEITLTGEAHALRAGEGVLTAHFRGRQDRIPVRVLGSSNAPASLPVPPASFVRDVLPALSKAGCNAGACHAKGDGQNGFKLSVFSYDPKSDFGEIVKEDRGRRIFPAAPDESLIIKKPTGAVPHEGGVRFERGSETHQLLARWLREGMAYSLTNEPVLERLVAFPRERRYRKGSSQRLLVQGHYSDGSVRDVTHLVGFSSNDKEIARVDEPGVIRIGTLAGQSVIVARYMGFVAALQILVPADHLLPPSDYAELPVHNFVDELAYAHFRRLGLFPSELCTDAEFLRRAKLDAIGLLPAPDEVRAFLADPSPDKRPRFIARVLDDPAYADYWANKWADLLRPNPDRVGVKSVFVLDQWLRDSFRRNQPYDQFVREILLAEGTNHRDGPAVIYRDRREPPELTTMFSQLFLGTRLECAKCHHHPNEKWSQDDFYQFAAFFGPLKQKGAGLSPPISAGTETFYFAPGGAVKHPVTGAVMSPRPPDGPNVTATENADPRRVLADWLTAPDNPFFAKAAVNRVWAVFFGRGLVEPVDDFRISNPCVNPPLLDALAADFAKHGYDLKHLMRTIMTSRLYQMSATPNEFNLADTRNFSRSYRRRLPAEVLLDAVSDVTGVPDTFGGTPLGTRATQVWSYKIESHFMDAFGRPNSSSDCPCERDRQLSVVQSLHMMNSTALQTKLGHKNGRVRQMAESTKKPGEIISELYLSTLSRPPADEERTLALATFTAPGATRQTATEDVLWALLNSAEFVLNH